MTIHFLCPNGHHLTAEPQRAGTAGACPRCRCTFLVPPTRPSTQRPATVAATDALSVFCPQGHRLRAPRDLAGQVRACPACQEPVSIPGRQTNARDRTLPIRGDDTDCSVPTTQAVSIAPWHRLIESLLHERTETTRLLVHLNDGRELQVEGLSHDSFGDAIGVLAVKSQDQARHVVAIRWSEVTECKLEDVEQYPPWMLT